MINNKVITINKNLKKNFICIVFQLVLVLEYEILSFIFTFFIARVVTFLIVLLYQNRIFLVLLIYSHF